MAKLLRPQDHPPIEARIYFECFPGPKIYAIINQNNKVIHQRDDGTSIWPWITTHQAVEWDAYMAVNEFSGNHRKNDEVVRCRAVFLDHDKPQDQIKDFPIPPSIVVQTSPGKYHYYWLTDTEDFATWERVQDRIVSIYDGDIGAKDLSRILRIPGTKNFKYKDKPTAELVECSNTVYDWEDILENFPPADPDIIKMTGDSLSSGKFNKNTAKTRFLTGESICPSMNSLIMHWAFRNDDNEVLDKTLKLFSLVDKETNEQHSKRYMAAKVQIPKFLGTARKKANAYKREKKLEELSTKVNIHYMQPQPLTNELVQSLPLNPEAFPEHLNDAAQECARYLSLGPDPALLAGLSTACGLLGKNVVISPINNSGFETYATIGLILVMETGTRKSSIYQLMNQPMRTFEKRLQKEWESQRLINVSSMALFDKLISKMEKEQIKIGGTPEEIMAAGQEIGALREQREKLQVYKPQLYMKDITEEELVRKMHENSGSMCIFSDDARNAIKNIIGRYTSSGTSEGLYIDGLTGNPSIEVKYNRAKDNGVELGFEGPALNAFFCVQQDLAIQLRKHEIYQTSGLGARLLMYFYPVDPVGVLKDTNLDKELDLTKMQPFYTALTNLCVRRMDNPLKVRMSKGARKRFNAFNMTYCDLVEADLSCHSFLNKSLTQACIYSTVMAALSDPSFASALKTGTDYEVSTVYANMGCMFMEGMLKQLYHTQPVLEEIELVRVAQKFAGSLQKKYDGGEYIDGFTRNSYLYQAFNVLNKDNYIPVVDYLVRRGWLGVSVDIDRPRSLNFGRTQGAKMGETVYHYNPKAMNAVQRLDVTKVI